MRVKPKLTTIILIIVLVILSVIVVMFWMSTTAKSSPWKDKDTDESIGTISQEIIVKYIDGSTESIALSNNSVLSVFYNDEPMESLQYTLKAKSDSGSVHVDISSYTPSFKVYRYGSLVNEYVFNETVEDIQQIVVYDEEFIELASWQCYPIYITPYTLEDGTYQLVLTPSGTIMYDNGYGWKESTLPDALAFEIDLEDDRVINLVFRSG